MRIIAICTYVIIKWLMSVSFLLSAVQAVAKAMRTSKVDKPSKVYVVTHKTSSGSVGQNSGGKGKLKFVDARMKKDARSMKNLAKKGKKGKKGKGKK